MGKSETKTTNETEPESSHFLPNVETSEILGLIELLRIKDGKEDIYKLAKELNMEFGETLTVIRAAELLGFVHTPGGDVVLEKLGEKLSQANINDRKALIKSQIEKIPVYQRIRDFLTEEEGQEASKNEVLEKLVELMPNENADQSFEALVHWGRYAELFGYNDDSHTFYLDMGEEESP